MRVRNEVTASRWLSSAIPAIGPATLLPRKTLWLRILIVLGLAVLLLLAKSFVSAKARSQVSIASLPNGHEMTQNLDVGATLSDLNLQILSNYYGMKSEVDLGNPNVADQVTAGSLHMGYLYLNVTPTAPLSMSQLSSLARFASQYAVGSSIMYIHDDVGGGRVLAAADMLLLLRGDPWPTVSATTTMAELSAAQLKAINQLRSALSHPGQVMIGNPYSGARLVQW
jgi:hypothetical protein